jgi:hypothetical protein
MPIRFADTLHEWAVACNCNKTCRVGSDDILEMQSFLQPLKPLIKPKPSEPKDKAPNVCKSHIVTVYGVNFPSLGIFNPLAEKENTCQSSPSTHRVND